MFKFGTIGAFKQVRNNPRCKATQDLVAGLAVLPNDATKLAPTPATADEAKGDVYFTGNIIDKPEIRNKADFKIEAGEFVLGFKASDADDLPVELSHDTVVGYDALVKGDVLVVAGDGTGKWVKADGTTIVAADYKVTLEVLEKTTFGDKGIYATVKVK
jgi:hypothetical protein